LRRGREFTDDEVTPLPVTPRTPETTEQRDLRSARAELAMCHVTARDLRRELTDALRQRDEMRQRAEAAEADARMLRAALAEAERRERNRR
jgi:hypothetical protein